MFQEFKDSQLDAKGARGWIRRNSSLRERPSDRRSRNTGCSHWTLHRRGGLLQKSLVVGLEGAKVHLGRRSSHIFR
jgi:hypothetical protein